VRTRAILHAGLAFSAVVGHVSLARAAEPPAAADGFQAALRVGYARPIGKLQSQAALELGNLFEAEIPIVLQAGWRLGDYWYLGAYGSIAGGTPGSVFAEPCSLSNCTAVSYRVGVEALVYLVPDGLLDPWLGLGVGYDVSRLDIEERSGKLFTAVHGFEIPRLAAGVDVRFSRLFAFGPTIDFAAGEYTRRTVETDRYSIDRPITQSAWHAWFSAGLRWVVFP